MLKVPLIQIIVPSTVSLVFILVHGCGGGGVGGGGVGGVGTGGIGVGGGHPSATLYCRELCYYSISKLLYWASLYGLRVVARMVQAN